MDYRVVRDDRPEAPLRKRIVSLAENAEGKDVPFLFGVSGGSTPRELYKELAEPFSRLRQVYLVQVDERIVGSDSEDRNWNMIDGVLARPAGIDAERCIVIGAEESAAEYSRRVQLLLEEHGRFGLDAVLLGVGEDGHTASVFPEEEDFHRPEPAYRSSSPRYSHPRITLSLSFLKKSEVLFLLAKGERKRAALQGVLSGDVALPAAYLPPERTEVYTDLD